MFVYKHVTFTLSQRCRISLIYIKCESRNTMLLKKCNFYTWVFFVFFLLNLIQRYCVFTELHETSEGSDSEIQK